MNQWFFETFLPSLFDRAGTNRRLWLTRAQTNICTEYMEKHTVRYEAIQGHENRLYFTTEWRDRQVSVTYSKKNGCGQIEFSFTPEEAAKAQRIAQSENEHTEAERLHRMKERHPDRYASRIAELERMIAETEEDMRLDAAEGDLSFLDSDRENLSRYRSELQKILSV